METIEQLARDIRSQLFDVRRSRRYHQARRAFFDRWNTVTNAVSLGFGSAAIYTVLQLADKPLVTVLLAATVSLASILNFVFGTVRKARLHHDLARDFIRLETKIVCTENPTREDLESWIARRHEIEAEEPPVKEVLDLIMHNKQSLAMGLPKDGRDFSATIYHIGPFKRALSQYIDLSADSIVTVKEWKEGKTKQQPKQLNPA